MSHTPEGDIVNWLRAASSCEIVRGGDALLAADVIETLRAALQTHAEEAAKLMQQRDELLGAVEQLCVRIYNEGSTPLDWPEYDAALAAITNATNPTERT